MNTHKSITILKFNCFGAKPDILVSSYCGIEVKINKIVKF